MVRVPRLELGAFRLGGGCSIHLSYTRTSGVKCQFNRGLAPPFSSSTMQSGGVAIESSLAFSLMFAGFIESADAFMQAGRRRVQVDPGRLHVGVAEGWTSIQALLLSLAIKIDRATSENFASASVGVLSGRLMRSSSVPGPAGERLARLSLEIDKRRLLHAFSETSHLRVEDLSSEALLVEYLGFLSLAMNRLRTEPDRMSVLVAEMGRWQSA